jgi:hypothetical protein
VPPRADGARSLTRCSTVAGTTHRVEEPAGSLERPRRQGMATATDDSPLVYQTGEEVRSGDEIRYHGEVGHVEFVARQRTGEPGQDWFIDEFPGGGVMIWATGMGSVFLGVDDLGDVLEFVQRGVVPPKAIPQSAVARSPLRAEDGSCACPCHASAATVMHPVECCSECPGCGLAVPIGPGHVCRGSRG